jgi:hypothetical protein
MSKTKKLPTNLIIMSDSDSYTNTEPSLKSAEETDEQITKEPNDEQSDEQNEELSEELNLEISDSNKLNLNSCNINLESEFQKLNCNDENMYSNKCNKFLLKKEFIEGDCLAKKPEENLYLYPDLNDPNFNVKIASKKEFNDTKYDGTIQKNIKEYADQLSKAEFELSPHQIFVKNFLSFQTPYSSLLLFHGLGSGKTCSSIGVCEEHRDYMKQTGITKRIIIVASENVQDNFKLQLFDERKLKLVDGIWNIRACTGNKLLKEINPMNMKGIPKEKVISQIKNLINTYYIFLGYGQFANYIIRTLNYTEELNKATEETKKLGKPTKDVKITLNNRIIKRLQKEFNDRLIVIDEVHNIRKTDDNENKKVALYLEILVKSAQNMRFLLLSATPMYNSYKEIIWLLNLMNTNDRRGRIEVKDVFKKNGDIKKNGKELLIRKATGYVSFVRGEDIYTFPYRIYPNQFAKENTFPFIKYPSYQMNLKKIKNEDKTRILSLYLNTIGDCNNCGLCQYCAYKYIIYNLRNKSFSVATKKGVVREMPNFENMESFGYTLLQVPIESLIISYPIEGLKHFLENIENETYSEELSESFSELSPRESESDDEQEPKSSLMSNLTEIYDEEPEIANITESKQTNKTTSNSKFGGETSSSSDGSSYEIRIDPHELTGKAGLRRMMTFIDEKSPPQKGNFEYKKTTLDKYGKIFSQKEIGKYSSKIKTVLDYIFNPTTEYVSEGIILIYSQYIDSGLVPMALALEEMGFVRYGQNAKSLFKDRPSEVVDVKTMKPPMNKRQFMPARYAMITGDTRLSPDNNYEVKGLTNEDNKEGHKIKVVLISKAGSEGIDLKYIRQCHILDPWYNMNRPEQIIGRAVRNFSHKDLPFEKRNVEIFMHGTILGKANKEEAADLYIYRIAEYKAIQIGKVTRILKETAVDCIINHDQTNFTQANISSMLKEKITQNLSSGLVINDLKIGDAPYSPACDYMKECYYSCIPNKKIDENNLNEDTYNEKFIVINSEKIMQRIRMLMKESFFYKKDVLIKSIQSPKIYPLVQIYAALTQLIEDNNEFIVDKYGRNGRLVNIGEYYLFQPIELIDKNISIYDRSVPIDYKHEMINFEINQQILKPVIDKRNMENIILEKENIIDTEKGNLTLNDMISNFNLTKEFTKQQKVPRGDDNWYKHCGIVMKRMSQEYPEMNEYLLEILVSHIIETLLYNEKLDLMDYIYSLENIDKEKNIVEYYSKKYFEEKSIVTNNFTAFILYNLSKMKIMILNENNKWVEAEPEDKRELLASPEGIKSLTFNDKQYNKNIGFIGYEKQNKYLVFKTKDITSKRDTGARCDEAGKEKTIKKINDIMGEEKYTSENTKMQKDTNGRVVRESISHNELCIIEEFILRYYNKIKKNNLKWFLTPEMALYHNLYQVKV